MDPDETLGRHGAIEVHDRGLDGPDRYTIVFAAGEGASASRVCDLVEVVTLSGHAPGESSWGLATDGEPFGPRIRFDQLPAAVQHRVRQLLDTPRSLRSARDDPRP